jgi:heavy metal sensor kinase
VSRIPLRLRLTLAFALAMTLVLAGVGAFLYARLGATLDERIGDDLEGRAAALASVLRERGASNIDLGLIAGEEGVAQVLGPDEAVLAASPGFDHASLVSSDSLTTLRVEEPPRGFTLDQTFAVGGSNEEHRLRVDAAGDFVTVVGESLEDRDEALDALLAQLLVVLPIAVLLTSAVGYLVAGAALRPVETMRRQAADISSETPEGRLQLPRANDEMRRLGETLNDMLDRLEAGLARERRLVADASHELRTPLAALRTELELALRRSRTHEEQEAALRSAHEEAERLTRLAEDLLVLSRADDGLMSLRPSQHDVRELLTQVARRFDSRARAANRALDVVVARERVIVADRLRLEQALSNLVDNALRHGRGAVRLSTREREGEIELHVTDDGPGFPPDFLPHAFERFSRLDEARSRSGTGLGLAIVEATARAHGGSAHADNRPGGGADVWMAIPTG